MKQMQRVGKFAIALAALCGFTAAAQADETQVTYNLAAGASTAAFGIPAANTPVSMTCVQNSVGFRGVGQATVLRVSPASFLEWVGIDIASQLSSGGNPGVVEEGFSGSAGTHMIYCDFSESVDIQVESATQVIVHNASSGKATGVITFVW